MQNHNNTREMLGQIAAACVEMARGFERCAELVDDSNRAERQEAYEQALATLNEMRHAVMVVAAGDGAVFTYTPRGNDEGTCENCCESLGAHVGEELRCASFEIAK